MYNCIIKYTHVIVSPITNNCININVPGKDEKVSVPKILLKMSFVYIHNGMVRPIPQDGVS